MYNEIGETLYSEELFGQYGDYCATVIPGTYDSATPVISFTEIPTVNNCDNTDCLLPTNTPTPTQTQTPSVTPTLSLTPSSDFLCNDEDADGLIHENEGGIVYPTPTPTPTVTTSPNYVIPSIKTVFIHVPNL